MDNSEGITAYIKQHYSSTSLKIGLFEEEIRLNFVPVIDDTPSHSMMSLASPLLQPCLTTRGNNVSSFDSSQESLSPTHSGGSQLIMSIPESPCVPQQSNSNDMVSTGSELITSNPDTPVTDSSSSAPGPCSGRKRRIDISDRSISPQTPPAGGILVDEKENALCKKFTENTCGCKKINGRPCSTQFSAEYIIEMRAQASLLTHDELDMVILGSLMTTLNRSENIVDGRHKPKKRERDYSDYTHNCLSVCTVTFGFLYGIGSKKRLQSLRSHYLENGMTPRVHGNTKSLPHNSLPFGIINAAVKFLQNYAEQHAILLPGRIPGYKRDDMKLLPSSSSKMVRIYQISRCKLYCMCTYTFERCYYFSRLKK